MSRVWHRSVTTYSQGAVSRVWHKNVTAYSQGAVSRVWHKSVTAYSQGRSSPGGRGLEKYGGVAGGH